MSNMNGIVLLLLAGSLQAQEFTAEQCAAAGVDVTGYKPTGTVVSEILDPSAWTGSCLDARCHTRPFGQETAHGDGTYSVKYTDLSTRTEAICRAEYEVRLRKPVERVTKPKPQ